MLVETSIRNRLPGVLKFEALRAPRICAYVVTWDNPSQRKPTSQSGEKKKYHQLIILCGKKLSAKLKLNWRTVVTFGLGGLVVRVLAFYSDDPSSNPTEAYSFFCKMYQI